MLQTIYEGESSFSTTEGRVGHQQLPNQTKMHNVNNSGDHLTARRLYSLLSSLLLYIHSLFSVSQSILSHQNSLRRVCA